MTDVVVGTPEITQTYPNGSPETETQDEYNRDTDETTTTSTTYAEGKDANTRGKRTGRTRLVTKPDPGPRDPKARRNKLHEVTETFDDDGDQVVDETEITYDGTVNEVPKEKIRRTFYTDPKALQEEWRYSWNGAAWVEESHYTFDPDGTPHKQ